VFRAVADPTRRELLDRLAKGELTVMKLAESFEMTLPAISQHLAVLRNAGLVTERRCGRFKLYTLNPRPLHEIADWVQPYERFWRARLAKLRQHLESNP
jgi:DNA-binding transcriptional ArsR family regulator